MADGYQLHPRLAADTIALGETSLCELRLMNDCTWPWVLLVPRRHGVREIYELTEREQQQLLRESSALGQGLMSLFQGDKLNVAALGNMVPQLHLHHIVRHQGDPAWPGPVWGAQPPVHYSDAQRELVLQKLAPVIASVSRA